MVLVHGAWHGAWCWELVVPQLEAAAIDATAVDLPLTGFDDDVAAVRAALDAQPGPVVLLGHSYGGAVITEAGTHAAVDHLVYLCAFVPDVGESCQSLALDPAFPATDLNPALRIDDGFTVATLDPELAVPALYGDCSAEAAAAAIARLRPQPLSALGATPTSPAWRSKPSTYVVCTGDRGIDPGMQRAMAAHTGTVVEWDTSHSPFLSQPDRFVGLLQELTA